MKEMSGGCCVCLDERGWAENKLVYCDGSGCNVAVHQACYGITKVPQGSWFCRKCESQERVSRVRCELCPSRDGALKRTDTGGWAHVVCALYIPEITFGDNRNMEPIVLSRFPKDRYNKTCYICAKGPRAEATYGASIKCARPSCRCYFHVTCGQKNGLLREDSQRDNRLVYHGFCIQHLDPKKPPGHRFPLYETLLADAPSATPESMISATGEDSIVSICGSAESSAGDRTLDAPTVTAEAVGSSSQEDPLPGAARGRGRGRGSGAKKRPVGRPRGSKVSAALSPKKNGQVLKGAKPNLPRTLEEFVECQAHLASDFLTQELGTCDVASMLNAVSTIRKENEELKQQIDELTARRDHLLQVETSLATVDEALLDKSTEDGDNTATAESRPSKTTPPPPPKPQTPVPSLLNGSANKTSPSSSSAASSSASSPSPVPSSRKRPKAKTQASTSLSSKKSKRSSGGSLPPSRSNSSRSSPTAAAAAAAAAATTTTTTTAVYATDDRYTPIAPAFPLTSYFQPPAPLPSIVTQSAGALFRPCVPPVNNGFPFYASLFNSDASSTSRNKVYAAGDGVASVTYSASPAAAAVAAQRQQLHYPLPSYYGNPHTSNTNFQ